ncbi:Putative membrane-associated protein [Neorhizobium galegae bv. orientalis]|nr:Putative membrane-associated protein [Neorhizobium galegae bv. orientalis]
MLLEELLARYGQLGIFIGSALEGETAAFLGGVTAHRKIISYPAASFAAASGSFLADEILFFAGRNANRLTIVQRLTKTSMPQRVTKLLDAHPVGFILSARFIYGMRTISPVVIGMSKIPALQFVLLNVLSAIIWGVVVTGIGYCFGNLVASLFGRLALHEHLALGLAAGIVAASGLALAFRRLVR